ncbi:MAG TPA: NrsF family protein [Paracoccaceae bacterium]|nr:NrsF family protein [Paracoccaceae bacterium]
MNTDDLAALLARNAGPAAPQGDLRHLALWLPPAWLLAVAAVALALGILPLAAWPVSGTVLKLTYATATAFGGLWLLRRAGRPGRTLRAPALILILTALAVAALGAADLLATPAPDRLARAMGGSALTCPIAILALALPALGATLTAARRLAPLDPTRAGLAAGLAAGGLAAAAYALACTEGATAFVAVWYSAGIALTGLLGAALGPRTLRW